MANHMSAREAWLIVRRGDPVMAPFETDFDDYRLAVDQYARACAIVEALVAAHEDMAELSDYDVTGAVAHVRALERGEQEKEGGA